MLGKVRNAGWCREESDGTLLKVQKYCLVGIMAKSKRKPSKFSAGREARRRRRSTCFPANALSLPSVRRTSSKTATDEKRSPGFGL
jgi:hypothetical protein